MSTINVKCQDQVLVLENTPPIASGGIGEDFVQFDFCNEWGGYARTAVFWRTEKEPFHQLLDENDFCAIPPEVLKEPGIFYFGVFGVNSEGGQRTSDVLPYRVNRGAITEGTKPSDPTPDIYTQLLQQYAKIEAGALGASRISLDEETAEALGLSQTDPTVKDALLGLQDQQTASDLVQAQHTEKLTEHDTSIAAAQKAIDDHKEDQTNPHKVTAEQAGAAAKLHASQHAADGDDPITPDAIRAVNDIVNSAEGTYIAVADSRNAEPVELRVFGKSEQDTTTGAQLFDLNDKTNFSSDITVSEEDIIEIDVDNSSGTDTLYFNIFTKVSDLLKPSTNYNVIVEVFSISTNSVIHVIDSYEDKYKGQFATYVDCLSVGTHTKGIKTRGSFDACGSMCRSWIEAKAGAVGKVKFRISVIEDTTVTAETFKYEKFTGGIPSPNPDYPQEIKSIGDGGQVKVGVYGGQLLAISDGQTSKNTATAEVSGDTIKLTSESSGVYRQSGAIDIRKDLSIRGKISISCAYTSSENMFILLRFLDSSNAILKDLVAYKLKSDESFVFNFEPTEGAKRFVAILCMNGSNSIDAGVSETIKGLMINIGETVIPWEPYKEPQTLPISTPNGLPGLEVTDPALATYTDENGKMWCADEVDFERGVYVKRIGRLALKDVSVWSRYVYSSGNVSYYNHNILTDSIDSYQAINGLCTHAYSRTSILLNADIISHSDKNKGIELKNITDTWGFTDDTSTIKSQIDAMGIELIYILAEPIETPLTAEQLAAYAAIHTNRPNTTVMNDCGAYMAMKYLRDIDDKTTSYLLAKIAKGAVTKQHASTHAAGGSDPLTPEDIGAAPATHASTHATTGADPITPSDIGAAAATHASQHATTGADPITPSDIGAAAATHASQHAADGDDPITPAAIGAVDKTGDTMTGDLTFASTKAVYLQRGSYKYKLSVATGGKFRVSMIDEEGSEVIGLTYSDGELGIGSSTNRAVTPKNAEELGIAQLAYGSYTGNATKDRVITCGFVPVLVLILAEASGIVDGSDTLGIMFGTGETLLVSDMSYVYGDTTTGGFKVGSSYFNKSSGVYHYVAIG